MIHSKLGRGQVHDKLDQSNCLELQLAIALNSGVNYLTRENLENVQELNNTNSCSDVINLCMTICNSVCLFVCLTQFEVFDEAVHHILTKLPPSHAYTPVKVKVHLLQYCFFFSFSVLVILKTSMDIIHTFAHLTLVSSAICFAYLLELGI